ncbi:MAG: ROK family protein [Actinomycetota bacterium]|nr:ROK family protein [Actinomycetota bacterium]
MRPAAPAAGRRAGVLLGVDIGGSKIAAGVVDPAGQIVRRWYRPTPRSGGASVMREVIDIACEAMKSTDITAIGVGAPGVVDSRLGRVIAASAILPGWAGTEVGAMLRDSTGLPVAVCNDVHAMALGEALHGVGRGLGRVLFASIGTGVGGALVFHGKLPAGSHGTAGEIAHLLVPGDGALECGCGRRDHLESAVAGPAIQASYARQTGTTGVELPEMVQRWHHGDQQARQVVLDAADLLGRALAGLASAVDIDGVVIGGGVAQIGEPFLDPIRAAFRESVIAPLREIPVRGAELGTDAPLIGAAEMVLPPAVTAGSPA